MSQAYSDPKREKDPHALPDLEVWYHDCTDSKEPCEMCDPEDPTAEYECSGIGWYWQSCLPGCLPDGEPNGPFATEEEALADAREGSKE